MKYKRNTACIHLYMHAEENKKLKSNLYTEGQKMDLHALLISAARMDENFYQALLDSADWLRRDEAE